MLKPRRAVEHMKEYHPPLGNRDGLRLDFNENVGGCSQRVLETLRSISPEVLNKYPEREPGERAVAAHLNVANKNVASEQVLLTNGVDEAIHLLCETYLEPCDEVLLVVPTFSMYEIYALATGATAVTVQADADFKFPTAKLLAAITSKTRLICIANPNNPTGAVASRDDLLAIISAAPHAAVLIDEAYYHFFGETLMDLVGTIDNLFVARTFSKAYGLAGFRLGALVGPVAQMKMVRRVGSPYNVNGVALECLLVALEDAAFIASYGEHVRAGRARLEAFYRENNIEYWPSRANFVLARFGEYRKPFVEEMRRRGILVRDRNSDPGCAGCVRITIGTEGQTEHLLRELPAALAAIGFTLPAAETRP